MFTKTFPTTIENVALPNLSGRPTNATFSLKFQRHRTERLDGRGKKRFYYFNYQFRCGLTNSAGTFCPVNINFIKITLLCDHFRRCCYFCLFFLLHCGEKRVFCLPHSCALPSPKANRNQIESLGNRKMFFFVGRLFFFIKTPNGARQTCQTFIDTPHSSICALCGPFDKHLLGNPITEFTFTVVTVSI